MAKILRFYYGLIIITGCEPVVKARSSWRAIYSLDIYHLKDGRSSIISG